MAMIYQCPFGFIGSSSHDYRKSGYDSQAYLAEYFKSRLP